MPIQLTPLSRREFLAGTLAAGTSLLSGRASLGAAIETDPHRVALLSDTHIAESAATIVSGVRMADHLTQVVAEVLALEARPACTLINGDCAYLDGKTTEYELFFDYIRPLHTAGMPVHLTLGNHDHRARLWGALPVASREEAAVEGRHVSIVPTPRANWFLLDTLLTPNTAPGGLGAAQLAWLARALDAAPEKPAIVMMHHHPDPKQPKGSLEDTNALFDVLRPRRQVKMLIFGHTHNWSIKKIDGIHLVNLPPVAYVFAKGRPSGWVNVALQQDAAILELRSIDQKHPQHRETHDLRWRT